LGGSSKILFYAVVGHPHFIILMAGRMITEINLPSSSLALTENHEVKEKGH
jgi:hypothetical protein